MLHRLASSEVKSLNKMPLFHCDVINICTGQRVLVDRTRITTVIYARRFRSIFTRVNIFTFMSMYIIRVLEH